MKKLGITLMLYSLFAIPMFAAGDLVATLYHASNDSISVYYGQTALQQAYGKSINGDIITLSSGMFDACNIQKDVTIRGAGMDEDTVNYISPTVINGSFTIDSSSPTTEVGPHFEGLYFMSTIDYAYDKYKYNDNSGRAGFLSNAQFVKCSFNMFLPSWETDSYLCNNTCFIDCVFRDLCEILGDASFINCVINEHDCAPVSGLGAPINQFNLVIEYHRKFENCVINVTDEGSSLNYLEGCSFKNCVIIHESADVNDTYFDANNTLSNTIVSAPGAGDVFKNLIINNANVQLASIGEIFKTYTEGATLTPQNCVLQDNIQTNYLGTDGTQVGIYGGAAPFTPYTEVPKIKKFHVANKSTAEGKLSVDIEVTTPSNTQ